MSCETCGRPAENGTPTHWLGCEGAQTPASRAPAAPAADPCEHDGCPEPKWSDGPRTKYCTIHKDPKNREK